VSLLRRGHVLLAIVSVLAAIVVVAPNMTAYSGGVADSNEQYGCSTNCHTVHSTSVITMSASTTTPATGGDVSVTVNVTGGEAANTPLGIMVISALTQTGSLPQDAGWTIVSDPTGSTAFNYHEDKSYSGSVSMTWSLKAPTTAGVYTLYAREIHGNGNTYSNDYTSGMVFAVGGGTPSVLTVYITSPAAGSEVSGTISVAASLMPSANISYATLSVDGRIIDNTSSAPFAWTLDTKQFSDGAHVVQVTAVNDTGAVGTKEIAININNAAAEEALLSWVWTMAAGVLLIVAIVTLAAISALMIRRRVMKGKVE
jgi:hypothetical protein